MSTENQNVQFVEVKDFKIMLSFNPETPLKVLDTGNGNWGLIEENSRSFTMRVQKDLDTSLPVKVLLKNGDLNDSCLINVKESAKVIAVF